MGGWVSDLKQAVRKLWQQPGFSAAVIVVLALGIGATTAMFSAVDAALLKPLPFAEPGRLVLLREIDIPLRWPAGTPQPPSPSVLSYADVARSHSLFVQTAAYATGGLNLTDAEKPERVRVGVVTPGFFATLGVAPIQGRAFTKDEGVPGGPDVAILSYGLWQTRFGGAPMLGKNITLSQHRYTVVGIMPPGFAFPASVGLWIPLTVPLTGATLRPFRGFLASQVIARLAGGVRVDAANQQLLARWSDLAKGQSSPYDAERLTWLRERGAVTSLQHELVGDRRTALLVLLGATGLLLLIGCVNVTNLLLSRAAGRRREIALRATLGATRGRIVRQLLIESVVLALAGAATGVALAPVALRLVRIVMPASLAGLTTPQVDVRVLLFATVLAVATGLAFGLWPAIGGSRTDVAETIKSGGGWGSTSAGRGRGRRTLLAAELALALVLLVGAGLMLRSLSQLLAAHTGLDPEHVGTLEVAFPPERAAERLRVITAALDWLEHGPSIDAAGVVNDLPLTGLGGISLRINPEGAAPAPEDGYFARYLMASAGYFRALGIPLIRGRLFTTADDSAAPRVVVINETLAHRAWPTEDAIGRQLNMGVSWGRKGPTQVPPYTVIGVVGDVREALDREPGMQMYFSAYAEPPGNLALVARGHLPSNVLLARLREAVRAADPTLPVYAVRMLDDVESASIAPRRANTALIAAFSGLALLITVLGVYAVVAYSVAQRTREMGIRVALGATARDLLALVGWEVSWVAVVGLALGLGAAWAASRLLASQLYGVTAHDALTFIVAPPALLLPVLVATLLPAWRARRVRPMDVIRTE